jgi:hypothetical protein
MPLTFSVGRQGLYLPWGIFCGVLTAIGAGLVSMWTPTTSVARWIGYQIVFGAGRGAGMQVVSSSNMFSLRQLIQLRLTPDSPL